MLTWNVICPYLAFWWFQCACPVRSLGIMIQFDEKLAVKEVDATATSTKIQLVKVKRRGA